MTIAGGEVGVSVGGTSVGVSVGGTGVEVCAISAVGGTEVGIMVTDIAVPDVAQLANARTLMLSKKNRVNFLIIYTSLYASHTISDNSSGLVRRCLVLFILIAQWLYSPMNWRK